MTQKPHMFPPHEGEKMHNDDRDGSAIGREDPSAEDVAAEEKDPDAKTVTFPCA